MLESRRHPGRRIARHHCSLHTSKQGRQSQRSRGPRPCGEVMSEMSFGCNPAWMIFFGLRWLDNHKQTKRLFRRKRPMWNRMILWWQWIEWLQLRDETSWGRFFLRRITRGDWKEKKPSGKLQAPKRPNGWNVKIMISKFGIFLSSEKLMFRWTVSKLQGYSPSTWFIIQLFRCLDSRKRHQPEPGTRFCHPFFCHLDVSRAFSTGQKKPNHLHSLELTSRIYTCQATK